MALDIGAGLSTMGTAVSQFAGTAALEQQKAALEEQKIKLADQLAGEREEKGRQFTTSEREATQTFTGGESQKNRDVTTGEGALNRTSEEKRSQISAGASVQSAAIHAGATVQAAQIGANAIPADVRTAQWYSKASPEERDAFEKTAPPNVYAQSRRDVADENSKTKLQLKAQADASGLSSEALDNAATAYNVTGVLPSYGMGGANVKLAIQNRAAQMRADSGMSTEQWLGGAAGAQAAKSAMGTLEKQAALANSFSATAEKNGQLLLGMLDKGAGPSGVPMIDRWIQAGRKDVAGDPEVSKLNAVMEAYKTEQAKVMSGATGASGITDAARTHVDGIISTASTPEQIRAVVETFSKERQNRIAGYDEQREALKSRVGGGNSAPAPTTTPAASQPTSTTPNPQAAPRSAPTPLSLPMKEGKVDTRTLQNGAVYNTNRGLGRWDAASGSFMPIEPSVAPGTVR